MAMTSSSRSRPTNTESRAHASSTATPALKRELDADLVVDAMGRSARAPAFLDSLGYGRPVAERSVASANYANLLM